MLRCTFIVFLFLIITPAAVAQQAGGDMQQQQRVINRLNWQLSQQQKDMDSLRHLIGTVEKENDSIQSMLYSRLQEVEDSISQLNYMMDEGFQLQQKALDEQMLKMRKRFFILAIIIFVLAVIVLVMFFYFGNRTRKNAYHMEERLDKQATRIQHKLEEKTIGIQDNINKQTSGLEERLNQEVESRITASKEDLANDKRLLHASALVLASELQDVQNMMLAGLEKKEARKYRKKASDIIKQLRRIGYDCREFEGKKVKENMHVEIENMSFDKAIGKRVEKTLRPQIKFGDRIIQKAILYVSEKARG